MMQIYGKRLIFAPVKGLRTILAAIAAMILAASCDNLGLEPKPAGKFDRVFIVLSYGYNNLSTNLEKNLKSLEEGEFMPSVNSSRNAVVVVSHSPAKYGDYSTQTRPCIVRMGTKSQGADNGSVPVRDTIGFFPSGTRSSSAGMLEEALRYIADMFPARHYTMLFSSHATGWLPPAYREPGIGALSAGRPAGESQEWPLTKSIGSQFIGSSSNSAEIELDDFAKAIPMKMDEIIFDACLMGGIEVAYQFRNVCDRLVFSPTEILSQGFIYETMAERIFRSSDADVTGICKDYIGYYMNQSGTYQSATITEIDCNALSGLADCCRSIFDHHRAGLASINRNATQGYFYDSKHWFYDLQDVIVNAGASSAELNELDKALRACVTYEAHTDKFFNLNLVRVCGLSMYLPNSSWGVLNEYYSGLDWNSATHLVE